MPFRPEMLLSEPGATLYIVSPITGAAGVQDEGLLVSIASTSWPPVGVIVG